MSELGVVVDDWDVVSIGELQPFVTSGSRGWAKFYAEYGAPFVRITNMSRETIELDLDDLRFVQLPEVGSEGARTALRDGDMLVSITADIGIISYVTEALPKPAYINQHIALVRFPEEALNSKFVSYFLASEEPQRLFRGLTDTGAKAGMSLITVRGLRVAKPPREEQDQIVAALEAADAMITQLGRLIGKKRGVKAGTMQTLLTGRAGAEEHSVVRLGDVATMSSGGTPVTTNPRYYGGGIPWVSISDMTRSGKFITRTERTLSEAGLVASSARLFPPGVVLYAMYASLGECSLAVERVSSSQAILGIEPGPQLDREYLYYFLQALKPQVVKMGQRGTQANLNAGMVRNLSLNLPPKDQQREIAEVLRDMDAELGLLEAKLRKAHDVRRGMMQQLLTGRTRLAEEAVAA